MDDNDYENYDIYFWTKNERFIQIVSITFAAHSVFLTTLLYVLYPILLKEWWSNFLMFGIFIPSAFLILVLSFLSPLRHRYVRYTWYITLSLHSIIIMILIYSIRIFCYYGIVVSVCAPQQSNASSTDPINSSFFAVLGPLISLIILRNDTGWQLLFMIIGLTSYIWSILLYPQTVNIWISVALITGAYAVSIISKKIQSKNAKKQYNLVNELKLEVDARNEAQKRQVVAERQRESFTSYIFHEIRVPLNAILLSLNYLDNLENFKEKLTNDENLYLNQIDSSLTLIENAINDTLDYRRTSSKGFILESRPFDLKEVVDQSISEIDNKHNVDFICNISPNLFILQNKVLGDSARVKQILFHFLSNAFTYTLRGSVNLQVNFENVTDNEAVFTVIVKDTGIGIKENDLHKLFKPFVSISSDVIQKKGTGLGLAITANLIRKMNGTYSVESTVGMGSTFKFSIPLKLSNEQIEQPTIVIPPQHTSKNYKIVFADDDDTTRRIMAKLFNKLGHSVDTAIDGQEALEVIRNKPEGFYDILFTDNQMPRVNGSELIRILRSENYKMPIVSITGSSNIDEQNELVKIGANYILIKPVSMSTVEKTIRMLIT